MKNPIDIIKKYENKKEFLQVKDFFSYAKLLVFITYKATGKSYSAMKACVEKIINGENFAWIRNTDIEMVNSRVADSFNQMFHEFGVEANYKVRNNGVYFVKDINNKNEQGLLVGMFLTMNKPFNTASQNALQKCTLIVYDEFINPTFHKKNLFSDFMKLAHTLMRKNKPHIILLGNKHEANNDILSELGMEFDWENGEHQAIYRPEQEVLGLYLNKWVINKMDGANQLVETWCQYSPAMKNFSAGNISNNNMYGVKNWHINKIGEVFKPMFNYDLNNTRYTVGRVDEGETKAVYIKQLDFNSEFDIKTYCYLAKDKQPDNVFVRDIHEMNSVEFLLRNYGNGNLWFSTAYAKNEFKYLLTFLKILNK